MPAALVSDWTAAVYWFGGKGTLIAQALSRGTAGATVKLKGGDRVLKAFYLGDANNASGASAEAPRFVDISNIMAPILRLLLD